MKSSRLVLQIAQSKLFLGALVLGCSILLGLCLCNSFRNQKTLVSRTPASSNPLSSSTLGPLSTESLPDVCKSFYEAVCQRKGDTNDPTGVVRSDVEGEKMALKIYQGIIREHRRWKLEQIDDALVAEIFSPKRRNRIESAYRWVLRTLKHWIDHQPRSVFSQQEKRQIKSRLDRTQLQLPPPAKIYEDEPDLLTKNEVYYERLLDGQMRLRVGGAFVFVAKSWFNLIFTLAHELGHAIDPCEIRTAQLSFPAYDRLTACFLKNNLIVMRKTRSECGANDQLSETFADWLAVQITAEALTQFATEFRGPQIMNAARNSVRDLCEQEDESEELDLEFHPSPRIRIEKIFGQNPKIRSLLGCFPDSSGDLNSGKRSYCTFSSYENSSL